MALSRVVSEIFNVEKCRDFEIRVKGQLVIENDTIQSGNHDFLLTFHSNYQPILHGFQDKRRFKSKIANFPTPCILRPS